MTKHIAIAALLAAGSAFANATEWTSIQSGSSAFNQARAPGFWFSLDSGRLSTSSDPASTPLDATVALDSIELAWTTSTSGVNVTCGFVLTDEALQIVAVSGTTATSTQNGNATIDFGGAAISSSATYSVWFVGTDALADLSAESTLDLSTDVLSGSQTAPGIKFANYVNTDLDSDGSLGVWHEIENGAADKWNTQYAPVVTVKTSTSAVPEPSAFGLLAGLGALALAASRRRRK